MQKAALYNIKNNKQAKIACKFKFFKKLLMAISILFLLFFAKHMA